MSARVRTLTASDVPTFLDLIDALLAYERLPLTSPEARERLTADALREPARFGVWLAEVNGRVVGYAVYFFTYSTLLGQPTLYLEDLFVLPEARGQGAGLALFRACADEALQQGCGRMDWQVLSWNTPAIEFYTRLGARPLEAWQSFRLDEAGLAQLAG